MDKFILKFVLFIAKLFLKKEVDFEKLKIIAETKLILDSRRVRVAIKNNKTDKEPKNQIIATFVVYGMMGLFISFLIPLIDDIVVSATIVHCYVLFMMALTLITDFSSVLLDTTDNQIILPRPVNSKTFFVARLVHILVYLLQFTLALSLAPIITIFIVFGVFVGLASICTILLTVLFSVFITYLLYGLILRFSSEQRLKDIISAFQIIMTIVFTAGFQIIPRLFNFSNIENITMPIKWYSYFLPPVWMANLLQTVKTFNVDFPHIGMIVLAITVPLFTFWIMIKYLAPSFSKKIAMLGNTGDEINSEIKISSKNKLPISEKLSRIFCVNKMERAGFELTWKMTGRDKSFKIQFYPSLAYIGVFAFIFIFSSTKNYITTWHNFSNTNNFLWFIYIPFFTVATAIQLISFNENFNAAWVYFSRPIEKPGSLISGSIKSILVKFMLPVIIILSAFSFYVWGTKIIDDFIFGFFNNILLLLIISLLDKCYLPFSMQPNVKQQTGKFVQVIIQLFTIAILVGLHYFALKVWWLVMLLTPISAITCYYLFYKMKNLGWQKINY